MRRRTQDDALTPANRPRWLVIQDQLNELVCSVELAADADPAQVLLAAMKQLEADGWLPEEPPSQTFAGFFVERDGMRLFVHIVAFDPSCPPRPQSQAKSEPLSAASLRRLRSDAAAQP